MRWVGVAALVVAAALHAGILLLPAASIPPAPIESSQNPGLPIVWRPVAPAPPTATAPSAPNPVSAQPETHPEHAGAAAASRVRTLTIDPVPEPAPELDPTISAEFEAIVPYPDTPPSSSDLGPPPGGAPPAGPDSSPILIQRVPPVYPSAAKSLRAEGTVTLRITVLADGSVVRAAVESCTRPGVGFEAAALTAVKRWRYAPAPFDDAPPRRVTVSVQFQGQGMLP